MRLKAPLLNKLQPVQDDLGTVHIAQDNFWDLLKAKAAPTDKGLRKDNFQRDLRNHVKNINEKKYIPISAFIQYTYNQRQNYSTCAKICHQIETCLGVKQTTDSVLALYKRVATFDFNRHLSIEVYVTKYTTGDPSGRSCRTFQ